MQPASFDTDSEQYDPPLLLTQAVPSLFYGQELNPVAPRAQRKVPLPPGLDLDEPINPNLADLIVAADYDPTLAGEDDKEDEEFRTYYYTKPSVTLAKSSQPASLGIDSAAAAKVGTGSYQNLAEEDYLDADILARRRRERQERNRDDPFYIFAPGETEGVTDADLEAIPVLELKLDDLPHLLPAAVRPRERERVQIAGDEGLDGDDAEEQEEQEEQVGRKKRKGKGLLQVDASGLVGYSLEGDGEEDVKRGEARAARKEIDRLRREMEAAAERIAAQRESLEVPEKRKGKKKVKGEGDGTGKKKKKMKKMKPESEATEGDEESKKAKKKKKKKSKKAEDPSAPVSAPDPAAAPRVVLYM